MLASSSRSPPPIRTPTVRSLACAQRARHSEATEHHAREHRFEGLCRAQQREHGRPPYILSL